MSSYLPSVLYFSGFLLMLVILSAFIRQLNSGVARNWFITGLALALLGFRIVQTLYRFPAGLYKIEIFSPVLFANSELLPSLGDLLLNSILILYIIVKFNRDFHVPDRFNYLRKTNEHSLYLILAIGVVFYHLFVYHIFKSLIFNSVIIKGRNLIGQRNSQVIILL
jgi:hypothetical protein